MDDFFEGQTPLDPDEKAQLIPGHIQLRSELNEFEAANIQLAVQKYFLKTRIPDLSSPRVIQKIHQDMFDQTWKWAGVYRKSNKNLGVDWWGIPQEVKKACDDFNYWQTNKIHSPVEMAVRYHHRLVWIHPFSNGNGRHARLVGDIYLHGLGFKPLSWGSKHLSNPDELRKKYIAALHKADRKDFTDLIELACS